MRFFVHTDVGDTALAEIVAHIPELPGTVTLPIQQAERGKDVWLRFAYHALTNTCFLAAALEGTGKRRLELSIHRTVFGADVHRQMIALDRYGLGSYASLLAAAVGLGYVAELGENLQPDSLEVLDNRKVRYIQFAAGLGKSFVDEFRRHLHP